MKKNLILSAIMAVMMILFGVSADAAAGPERSDFTVPKDGDVDGMDLYDFLTTYSAGDPAANVDGVGDIDSGDVAAFAEDFGTTYSTSTAKPNILILIADDIGIDVSTDLYPGIIEELEFKYGAGSGVRGKPASMPQVVSRIAEEGMLFDNAWAQPSCSPTRAAMITGLYAKKTGVKSAGTAMSSNHITFVQQLKQYAGYSTAAFGKWHLAGGSSPYTETLPKAAGFELFKGHVDGAVEDYWDYNYDVQDDSHSPTEFTRVRPVPEAKSLPGIAATTYAPVVKGRDVIDWINAREDTNPDKPWLVWLAFNEAHWDWDGYNLHVPNGDTIGCHPTNPDLDGPVCQEIKSCGGSPGSNNNGSCENKVLVRAMTTAMDTVVGRILDAVYARDPNTYIIFIGDNGTEAGSIDNMYLTTAGRGKGTAYESGARVAMAIRGPGIETGSQSFEFVHVADLFNTCMEIGGLSPMTQNVDRNGATVNSDSVSLAPILFGDPVTFVRDPNSDFIITENGNTAGARNGFYKVICKSNFFSKTWEFYNLIDDPLEETKINTTGVECSAYGTDYMPSQWQWHYCRLREVIETESIISSP